MIVDLEQTLLDTVFGSTHLKCTDYNWQHCNSSDHIGLVDNIGLVLNSTGIYSFYFGVGLCLATHKFGCHHFIIWASLLDNMLSKLLLRHYWQLCCCSTHTGLSQNFTGIRFFWLSYISPTPTMVVLTACIHYFIHWSHCWHTYQGLYQKDKVSGNGMLCYKCPFRKCFVASGPLSNKGPPLLKWRALYGE